MFDWGVLDFAGGTVVHISSGVSGLVAALMIGKRNGYRKVPFVPHNLVYTVMGGSHAVGRLVRLQCRLGAGGFGQCRHGDAGDARSRRPRRRWPGCSASGAAKGQPSVLGIVSGAVAGLVGITPASGFVDPLGALVIGVAAGVGCFFASTFVKNKLGYDDALDAFGVHGVGGTIGALADRRVRHHGGQGRRRAGRPDRRQCRPDRDPGARASS